MTFSLHAFNSTDTSFDVQAAALEDVRPHPTEAALTQLGRAMMTELLDVIKENKIEPKDVRTESFTLQPRYDGAWESRRIVGYEARKTLVVTLHEPAQTYPLSTSCRSASSGCSSWSSRLLTPRGGSSWYTEGMREITGAASVV